MKRKVWLLLCGIGLNVIAFSTYDGLQTAIDLFEEDHEKQASVEVEKKQKDLLVVDQPEAAPSKEKEETSSQKTNSSASKQDGLQTTIDPLDKSYEKKTIAVLDIHQNDRILADRQETMQPSEPMSARANAIEFSSRIHVGADYTHVNIKPHGHPGFNGSLGGLQGLYEYRPKNFFYGAGKLAWKEGSTHGSAGRRSLLYVDLQERLGYTFGSTSTDSMLTLFTGFGYRHLGQKFSPKQDESLRFRYNEIYIPVGFIADYEIYSCFSLGLGFTWMPQVYPTVSIIPLKGSRWILTDTLANFSVEMPFDFTLTKNKRLHLTVTPFYERWEDGSSTAKTETGIHLGLPGNTYNFYGADVNLSYRF